MKWFRVLGCRGLGAWVLIKGLCFKVQASEFGVQGVKRVKCVKCAKSVGCKVEVQIPEVVTVRTGFVRDRLAAKGLQMLELIRQDPDLTVTKNSSSSAATPELQVVTGL